MLINGSPKVNSPAIHPQEDLVQVPRLPSSCLSAPQRFCEERPELLGPTPHLFVRHPGPSFGQEFLYVTMAQRKAVVQPDRIADDLCWESIPMKVAGAITPVFVTLVLLGKGGQAWHAGVTLPSRSSTCFGRRKSGRHSSAEQARYSRDTQGTTLRSVEIVCGKDCPLRSALAPDKRRGTTMFIVAYPRLCHPRTLRGRYSGQLRIARAVTRDVPPGRPVSDRSDGPGIDVKLL